jgi:hypothetical protein
MLTKWNNPNAIAEIPIDFHSEYLFRKSVKMTPRKPISSKTLRKEVKKPIDFGGRSTETLKTKRRKDMVIDRPWEIR